MAERRARELFRIPKGSSSLILSLHVRYTSIDSHLFRSIPSPFLLGFCDQDPQKSGCEGFARGTYV